MACRYREENRQEYGRTLRILTLENGLISAQVQPWDGGRVTSLYDRRKQHEHIWTNPRTRHLSRTYAANYDDLSASGIEEAFPTVGSCRVAGATLPFFGEVWSVPWDYRILSCIDDEIVLELSCYSSIYPARVTKTLRMQANSPDLTTDYEIINLGADIFPFVFGVHPSICLSPGAAIDLPEGEYRVEFLHPSDQETARIFQWPNYGAIDLSKSGRPDDNRCFNFLTEKVNRGIYRFTDAGSESCLAIEFDHSYFPCLSIWLIYGGWRGYYCAMTEFFTSWPAALDKAQKAGLSKTLSPGEKARTSVKYSISSN